MPLNLNASFNPRIKTCRGWKSHFTGCAREVIGALELLAKNRVDRFIFPSVDAVVKLCNKRRDKEQVYSKRTVEKCLQAFRELQILHADNGAVVDCVKRNGWTLNPHDAMTKRYPAACVFIGPGKTSGVWLADGKWQPDEGREEFGLVVEAYPEPSPAASLVRDKSVSGDGAKAYANTEQKRKRVRNESVSDDGIGCGVGCATENEDLFDIEADSDESAAESRQENSSKIEAEPLKPLEPIKPIEPPEPPQPLQPAKPVEKNCGSGSGDAKTVSYGKTRRGAAQLAIDLFQRLTGFIPRKVSRQQKLALDQFDGEFGREAYRAAINVWLKESPWDENTASHLSNLVENFLSYHQKAEDNKVRAAKAVTQKQLEERAAKHAASVHVLAWLPAEPNAEEKARIDEITKRLNDWKETDDDGKFLHDLTYVLLERSKAAKEKERADVKDALEKGNW